MVEVGWGRYLFLIGNESALAGRIGSIMKRFGITDGKIKIE